MHKTYYVYIMASKPMGTLYIGITNDIERRVHEHKYKPKGFVKKYHVNQLAYMEEFSDVEEAIAREKSLKRWNRQWKINLIEERNFYWEDLSRLWQITP